MHLPKALRPDYNSGAKLQYSGRGSARLERCVRDAEVPGSNPGAPTTNKKDGRFRPFCCMFKLVDLAQI